MRNRIFYCLAVAAAEAVLLFLPLAGQTVTIWQIVDRLSFYDVSVSQGSILNFFYDLFPYLIFQILWGVYLYEEFCTASVYFFSRKDDKGRWYLGECLKLYLWGVVFLLCLVFVGMLFLVLLGGKITWDLPSLYILVAYILLYSVFLFATALFVNLLAVRIRSVYGLGVVVSLEFLAIAMYGVLDKFMELTPEENNVTGKRLMALKCDPFSHLVFKWHGSILEKVNAITNEFQLSFWIEESVLVWTVAAAVIMIAGYFVIKQTELIENERE